MKNRGFTLIELLVVISIIGILSGIILVGLSIARDRARDARVKEELINLRTAMELYYSEHKTYQDSNDGTTACGDAKVAQIVESINSITIPDGICYDDYITGWIAIAHLPSDKEYNDTPLNENASWWCVDSRGASKKITVGEFSSPTNPNPGYCP